MRDAINNRARTLGLTTYAVWKLVDGKVTKQAVYDFLSGRRDMSTRFASHLLAALGLEIRPKR